VGQRDAPTSYAAKTPLVVLGKLRRDAISHHGTVNLEQAITTSFQHPHATSKVSLNWEPRRHRLYPVDTDEERIQRYMGAGLTGNAPEAQAPVIQRDPA
jgi:hypothetical protein